jgi:NTP pyrophosphatase (non-canonical NTP hydrolase)
MIKKIADHYGFENQKEKLLEELEELEEALTDNMPIEDLITELADVQIMTEQIVYLLGIEEEVEKEREFKLTRQAKRMEGESESI